MTCMEMVLKEPAFYDNSTGKPPAFITSDLCPNQCSFNGVCNQGTCTCNAGFVGYDCAINTRLPASINDIIGGDVCDVKRRPCRTIYVSGDNMQDTSTFQCRLKELKYTSNGFLSTGKVYDVRNKHMSLYHVGCLMPARPDKTVVAYQISVTNDRHLYSNTSETVYIIDTQCMTCSGGHSCSIKANTCLIDGLCRAAHGNKPGDTNLICDPTKSQTNWISQLTTPKETTKAPTTQAPFRPATTETLTAAPMGGEPPISFDIWTRSKTGCMCTFDMSRFDCACCDEDACQCPEGNHTQCVQCGFVDKCGIPLPAPNYGVDGYTLALSDCQCQHGDLSASNCACCQNGGCQCGPRQKNQCVNCHHMDRCGSKPWIYGPPFPDN